MGFIAILIATAVAIAGSAAYCSIYGLAQIWNAAFWTVIILGTSIEFGKLVTVSYLYRYWNDTAKLLRGYMMAAIMVLMLVTSGGIFGFLSAAYQKDILPLEQMNAQVAQLVAQKTEWSELKTERLERRKQIDTDIASLPNNYITGRQRLMKSYGPELIQIRQDIEYYTEQLQAATTQIHELKSQVIQQEVHTGPIIFIAKAFDQTVDTAVKWMTLLIIFAFDPLAVALTIGANIAIMKRKPLEVLLEEITPENLHPETDTGEPVGRETFGDELVSADGGKKHEWVKTFNNKS